MANYNFQTYSNKGKLCSKRYKTVTATQNSVLQLESEYSAFNGIRKVHTEPMKTTIISDYSHPILIPYYCCQTVPGKFGIPKLRPLKSDNINIDELDVANQKMEITLEISTI